MYGCAYIDVVRPDVLRNMVNVYRGLIEMDGAKYRLTIDYLNLTVPTLRLSIMRGGDGEGAGGRFTIGEYSILVSTKPPIITVKSGDYVVFSTENWFIRGMYVDSGQLHVPILISPGEGIYGLGEWFGRLNKVGQRLEIYVYDAVGLPGDKTYVAYPFYWSTRGYGLLVNTHCRVIFDFGSRYPEVGEIAIPMHGDGVELYLFLSNDPGRIIKAFWDLTGEPEVPPLWSFGVWYSLWRDSGYMYSEYRTQDDVVRFAEEVRRRGLPGDVIHIDPIYTIRPLKESIKTFLRDRLGLSEDEVRQIEEYHRVNGRWSFKAVFDYIKAKYPDKYSIFEHEYVGYGQGCTFQWHDGFPNPKAMVDRLHELGFRVSIWVNPYAPKGSEWYSELESRGLLVKVNGVPGVEMPGVRGGVVVDYRYRVTDIAAVDFTNPEACRAYAGKIRSLLELGIDVVKTDYGEGAPEDGEYFIGHDPCIHNLYPVLYNKLVYETIREVKGEAMVWGRSGGLGIHRYPIRWTGDPDSTPRGMAASLRAVLSMATSGIMYSSIDIGGYGGRPTPELYVRWAQMGLLLSHSRFHGVSEREPWRYGDEAYSIVKSYIKLRYLLIPYIYSEVIKGLKTGKPLVRPLVMDYPDDQVARNIDDEYLFGSSMLIAPVFEGHVRQVYLPRGRWHDYWDGSIYEGPTAIEVKAPLDKILIFIKDNSTIPYTAINIDRITEEALFNLKVEVYGNVDLFEADFGKYGSVKTPVSIGKEVHAGPFKITFMKPSEKRT